MPKSVKVFINLRIEYDDLLQDILVEFDGVSTGWIAEGFLDGWEFGVGKPLGEGGFSKVQSTIIDIKKMECNWLSYTPFRYGFL